MINFKMLQQVKVVNTDSLNETILSILKESGYQRPLFVMDSFLAKVPAIQELEQSLKDHAINFGIFDRVVSDPPMSTINGGVAAFEAHKADSLIAIGGGSSIDVARGINIVRVNGGQIEDYTNPDVKIKYTPGLIAIPTTSGTGSEVSNALVVTNENTHEKQAILADEAVSEFAVLNPDLVLSLPKNMTIATRLDAFSHAAEGYLSTLSSPMTDAVNEKVMFLLYNYLPRAVANGQDREARERVMVAATLAGWMLNNAGTNVGHSMAHILGSKFHLVHGEAVAYGLPGVMRLVGPIWTKKVREIGQILGATYPANASDDEITKIAVDAYKTFRDQTVGLHPFADYHIDSNELLANVDDVLHERFAGNTPVELTQQNVTTLLEQFGQ